MPNSRYKTFVGIDVSKETLDFYFLTSKQSLHRRIGNSTVELKAFFREEEVKQFKLSQALFCLEHTGVYQEPVVELLYRRKYAVSIQNPLHVKLSLGMVRGKSDKTDAERIAIFASKNPDIKLWSSPRPPILLLKELLRIRRNLTNAKVMLNTSVRSKVGFVKEEILEMHTHFRLQSMTGLGADLKALECQLKEVVQKDEYLLKLYSMLTSIKAFGPIAAYYFIVLTNEFRDFDKPTHFASFIGVAPFGHTSGSSINKKPRVSPYGNKEMKSVLHVVVIASLRCNPEIKQYYDRKRAEGKHSWLIFNNIKNKLIRQVFACVKEDRLWLARPT